MSVDRIYYCETPDCGSHVQSATPPPYIPGGFIGTSQTLPDDGEETHHFCSWDCLMKYAAKQPVCERIELDDA